MAPPCGFTCAASSANLQLPQHGERLRGKRFVELDQIDLLERHAEPREELARGGYRAHAHDARRHPRDRGPHDARARREAEALDRSPRTPTAARRRRR